MNPIRLVSFIALTAVGAAGSLRAASQFEGHVDMQILNPDRPQEVLVMHYALKGDKARIDMPSQSRGHENGTMAMIVDNNTHQMLMLLDSGDGHKMAMRHAIPTPKPAAASDNSQTGKGDSGLDSHPPVPTGRSEMILGYKADEYRTTDKRGDQIDLWLVKGLGNFMAPGGSGGFGRRSGPNIPAEWQNFSETAGSFPMRMVIEDKKGKTTMKMEVIKLDKQPVPDSAFSSEGYQEMQMPSFGNLFGH